MRATAPPWSQDNARSCLAHRNFCPFHSSVRLANVQPVKGTACGWLGQSGSSQQKALIKRRVREYHHRSKPSLCRPRLRRPHAHLLFDVPQGLTLPGGYSPNPHRPPPWGKEARAPWEHHHYSAHVTLVLRARVVAYRRTPRNDEAADPAGLVSWCIRVKRCIPCGETAKTGSMTMSRIHGRESCAPFGACRRANRPMGFVVRWNRPEEMGHAAAPGLAAFQRLYPFVTK